MYTNSYIRRPDVTKLLWVVVGKALVDHAQTSKTKSETTSFLKHPEGNPLGTTTTLLGLWIMCGGDFCHDVPATSHPDGTDASSLKCSYWRLVLHH